MTWTRGRRWSLVAAIGAVLVLALVITAGIPRWQAHRAEDRPEWFGQNYLASGAGLSQVTAFPAAGSTVIAGSTPFGLNSFILVTENADRQRGIFTARGTQGIDAQGDAWAIGEGAELIHHRFDSVARGWPASAEIVWSGQETDGESLSLLAAEEDVAIVERGCRSDGPCEVVGVQGSGGGDPRVLWRHDASDGVGLVHAPGGVITQATTARTVALAGVGAFVQDGRLTLVDTEGARTPTDLTVEELEDFRRTSIGLVGGRLVTVTKDGESCTVTADTTDGRQWTSDPAPCHNTEQRLTQDTLYLMRSTNVTGSSFDSVVAVSLADGSVSRLENLVGLVGLGSDLVVDGEGGRYRAQSATTGETVWTTELDGADPQDSPGLGTGRASVGPEVVVVVHEPSTWTRRLSGNDGQRVSLLDRETGEVLTTAAAPDGSTFNDVVALEGRRALLFGSNDQVGLLTP